MLDRTFVGLDVHARSVMAGVLDGVSGEVRTERLPAGVDEVVGWAARLAGPVRVAYEAGPTGFGLARAFEVVGIGCTVAAPSKLERPSGDRVECR